MAKIRQRSIGRPEGNNEDEDALDVHGIFVSAAVTDERG
jgi:hypothetical protein